MRTPKPVRGLARGLMALEALNRRGSATALELARDTAIPRPTIYRLMQTLLEEGYVTRSPSDDRFRPRLKVRALSDGFEDEHWIGAVAAPAMQALTRRLLWPCDLMTLEGTHLVIRETTHRIAPYSIDRNMAGREIPLLESSAGQAYLAALPEAEARELVGLAARDEVEARAALRGVAGARRRGHGLRQGGPRWPHTGSVALPVRHQGRLLGSLSVIWMARVIGQQEGVARCLGALAETVAEIEAALERGDG
ncbi:helix-turn-helix domain-containing protein [Rhodovarius crocodyli]|nr:helix-turn-helix domain-containing protein [Rhodovarius crocodyli]